MACGPKCSGFVMGVSLWGLIMMVILGGLFYNESVGLLEDLPTELNATGNWEERKKDIQQMYRQNAYNSWIAGAIHLGIFFLAAFRFCCVVR